MVGVRNVRAVVIAVAVIRFVSSAAWSPATVAGGLRPGGWLPAGRPRCWGDRTIRVDRFGTLSRVTDFYGRFGSVSLTLLGLWVIVVQTRYEAWAGSVRHRRQATAVALIFGLPGSMSFLSLVDPTRPLVWRASFVVGGAVGATGVLAVVVDRTLRPSDPRATIGLWTGGLLHSAIALIALVAGPLGRSRFGLTPLETEALLFSLVLSAGLAVAWLLLFADDDRATPAD